MARLRPGTVDAVLAGPDCRWTATRVHANQKHSSCRATRAGSLDEIVSGTAQRSAPQSIDGEQCFADRRRRPEAAFAVGVGNKPRCKQSGCRRQWQQCQTAKAQTQTQQINNLVAGELTAERDLRFAANLSAATSTHQADSTRCPPKSTTGLQSTTRGRWWWSKIVYTLQSDSTSATSTVLSANNVSVLYSDNFGVAIVFVIELFAEQTTG